MAALIPGWVSYASFAVRNMTLGEAVTGIGDEALIGTSSALLLFLGLPGAFIADWLAPRLPKWVSVVAASAWCAAMAFVWWRFYSADLWAARAQLALLCVPFVALVFVVLAWFARTSPFPPYVIWLPALVILALVPTHFIQEQIEWPSLRLPIYGPFGFWFLNLGWMGVLLPGSLFASLKERGLVAPQDIAPWPWWLTRAALGAMLGFVPVLFYFAERAWFAGCGGISGSYQWTVALTNIAVFGFAPAVTVLLAGEPQRMSVASP